MVTEATNLGWAAFAAPEEGWGLLVPLSPQILEAGAPLAERAHDRALERYGDLGVAPDILAGNALLAGADGGNARGIVAACLGGIARLTQSRAFVVTAVRRGDGMDCAVERLDRKVPVQRHGASVRARLAELLGLPPDRIVSGAFITAAP